MKLNGISSQSNLLFILFILMKLNDIIELWDSVLFAVYNLFIRFYTLIDFKTQNVIRKNKSLRNSHKGERCFVVMNGPSLNQYNLDAIKKEIVFVANYFYRSSLVEVVDPNYYVWLDSDFSGTSMDLSQLFSDIHTKCPNAKMLLNYKMHPYLNGSDSYIHFVKAKHLPNTFNLKGNLSGLTSNFTSVVFFAIISAIYMGFKNIYLLGLDFEPGGFVHFEDLGEGTECDKPSMKVMKSDVCGLHWQYARAQYESFWVARFAKKHKCNVFNMNKNSHIRAFDFADYDSLF